MTTDSQTGSRAYDWRQELGEVNPPEKKLPGQTNRMHPLTAALAQPAHKRAGLKVLKKALAVSEGRLDWLAELLECSWHLAGRLVKQAELQERATELRVANGHPGPTGRGLSPRKPRTKAA